MIWRAPATGPGGEQSLAGLADCTVVVGAVTGMRAVLNLAVRGNRAGLAVTRCGVGAVTGMRAVRNLAMRGDRAWFAVAGFGQATWAVPGMRLDGEGSAAA